MSVNDGKLSVEECRKILCNDGVEYSDEDVIRVRDFLELIAEIATNQILRNTSDRTDPKIQ